MLNLSCAEPNCNKKPNGLNMAVTECVMIWNSGRYAQKYTPLGLIVGGSYCTFEIVDPL